MILYSVKNLKIFTLEFLAVSYYLFSHFRMVSSYSFLLDVHYDSKYANRMHKIRYWKYFLITL